MLKNYNLFFIVFGFLFISSCGLERQSALGRKLFVQKEKPQKSIFSNAHKKQEIEIIPQIQLNGFNASPVIVAARNDTSLFTNFPVLDVQSNTFNKNVFKQLKPIVKQFKPLLIKKTLFQKATQLKNEKEYYEDVNDKKIKNYSLVGLIFSCISIVTFNVFIFLMLIEILFSIAFVFIFAFAMIGMLFSINSLLKIKRKRKQEDGAYKKQLVMTIFGVIFGALVLLMFLLIIIVLFALLILSI